MRQRRFAGKLGFSVAMHAMVLGALFVTVSHAPHIAPYRLPGTPKGAHLLAYYSPGAAAAMYSDGPLLPLKTRTASKTPTLKAPAAAPATVAARAEQGTGNAAVSGLGNGEITMAYQRIFPPPHPDLSTLAPGHHGEVVLNAVIDEQGKITQLTLLKGINPTINDTVIATVQNWIYQPATRDGSAVPSEQELHFYYERG